VSALEYSDDALNALDAFMECDHILFVEGDDDVLFWRTVFEKCSNLTVDIRPVGGVNELQPYVDKVKGGDLTCLVAQDSDYTRYVPGFVRHPRVLYTFGYSIENTIYKSDLISSVIGFWSKKDIDCLKDVDSWLGRFSDLVGPLFHLDFVNFRKGLEIDVGAGHCQKFMMSRTSEEIDHLSLNQHLERLHMDHGIVCTDDDYKLIESVPVVLLMRGHFLQSAVLRFVNKKIRDFGRKASVSVDALYAHALHYFQNGFSWRSVEGRYYARQIRNINQLTQE